MNKPNIKVTRIDERLIHGQGQLWIRSLGVNLVICANDDVANNKVQQSLMSSVISGDVNVRFWTIEKTAEIIWKAAPHQTIFVIVKSPEDVRRLCDLGYPIDKLNVGNIHAAEGKEKISQFIYVDEKDKENLRILKDKYNAKFDTKTSPVTRDGEQALEPLLKAISGKSL